MFVYRELPVNRHNGSYIFSSAPIGFGLIKSLLRHCSSDDVTVCCVAFAPDAAESFSHSSLYSHWGTPS